MHRGGDSIFSKYVTLAGGNFLAAIFGFLVATLLARQFGPAGFGVISLAATLVSYAMVISNCGTSLYAVRAVAVGQNSPEQMIPAVIAIRLLLSIVALTGLAASAYYIPQLYESRYLILLFGITLFSNSILLVWVPQAVHRTNAVAASNVMLQFLYLGLLYLLLIFNSDLYMAPIALIVAEVLVAVGLMLSIRRYVSGITLPGLSAILVILRESAPIGLTQFVRTIALASDLVILGLMSDYSDVGIYAAAYKLFLFMLSLAGAYFIILLPLIAEISTSNRLIVKELRASFLRVLPIVVSALIVVWFIADFLINLLFGVDYAAGADVLRVLSLAIIANVVARHYRQVLLAKKMQTTDLKLSGISAVIHLLAKVLLIPFFGIIGSALGTLIGEISLMIGLRIVVMREIKH